MWSSRVALLAVATVATLACGRIGPGTTHQRPAPPAPPPGERPSVTYGPTVYEPLSPLDEAIAREKAKAARAREEVARGEARIAANKPLPRAVAQAKADGAAQGYRLVTDSSLNLEHGDVVARLVDVQDGGSYVLMILSSTSFTSRYGDIAIKNNYGHAMAAPRYSGGVYVATDHIPSALGDYHLWVVPDGAATDGHLLVFQR